MARQQRKPPSDGERRYSVAGVITISVHTEVEASSPEEAREIAVNERGIMTLCHGCAGADASTAWVTSGELDCDMAEPHDGLAEFEVVEL